MYTKPFFLHALYTKMCSHIRTHVRKHATTHMHACKTQTHARRQIPHNKGPFPFDYKSENTVRKYSATKHKTSFLMRQHLCLSPAPVAASAFPTKPPSSFVLISLQPPTPAHKPPLSYTQSHTFQHAQHTGQEDSQSALFGAPKPCLSLLTS